MVFFGVQFEKLGVYGSFEYEQIEVDYGWGVWSVVERIVSFFVYCRCIDRCCVWGRFEVDIMGGGGGGVFDEGVEVVGYCVGQ